MSFLRTGCIVSWEEKEAKNEFFLELTKKQLRTERRREKRWEWRAVFCLRLLASFLLSSLCAHCFSFLWKKVSKKKKHKRKRVVFSLKAVTLWPRRRLAESGELHRFVMMMGKTNESQKWKSSTFLLFHHLPYFLGVSLFVFFSVFHLLVKTDPFSPRSSFLF